jgi:beta-glucosidase
LIKNILHGEFGFRRLISEEFIIHPVYAYLNEAVMNGVTMSCNTGDNSLEAVAAYYPNLSWNVETVGKDSELQKALKYAMKKQNYALANSNAMDGLVPGAHLENVKTWYDKLIMGLEIAFGLITLLGAVMYFRKRNA